MEKKKKKKREEKIKKCKDYNIYAYLLLKQKALGLPLRNIKILKMEESGGCHALLYLLHS